MQNDLTNDQHVSLYPSYAYFDFKTDLWTIPFAGFIYRDGRDSMRQKVFLRLLQQVLDVEEGQLKANPRFAQRIEGFLQEPQRAKNVALSIGDKDLVVSAKSRRSGHVRLSVAVPKESVPASWLQRLPTADKMTFSVSLSEGDQTELKTEAYAVPPQGVSVISDVDDTIKISQVAHRRQLLHNTFLHEFIPVPGMALLYQQWKDQGAAFHYVSSSPWQLFSPLNEFLMDHGFPEGSFHLRTYRFGDPSILKLFMSRKRNKFKIIESIYLQFPQRQFVLIGDSGEKDAEIYGKVARRFPHQTKQILIRRVEGRPWTNKRVAKAFRRVPEDCWQTFQVPTQIRDITMSHH